MNAWDVFVRALIRRPKVSLAFGAVLVLASAALAPGIAFTSDATEHLPKVSPAVKDWLDLSQRFGAFQSLVIGLEEPSQSFTADGLAHVKRVTDRLAAAKANGVLSVTSVTNVDSIREAQDGSIETELLIPSIPTDPAGLEALSKRVAADQQVSGALISRDQRGYLVLVRADPRRDSAELGRLVHQIVEAERGPLSSAYFGAPFFSAAITRNVYARLSWLVPVFILLLAAVLAWRVQRWSVVGLVLGADALVLVVWLGLVRAMHVVLSFTSLTALLVLTVLATIAFSRGIEKRLGAKVPAASPFPAEVAAALVAVGLASLALKPLPIVFLATCGVVIAVGALSILLVGLFVFAPLAGQLAPQPAPVRELSRSWPAPVALGLAALVLVGGGVIAPRIPFAATPQTIFSSGDEIGRSLSFFDRRFGGPDFIQVGFKGDLRDPNVAARLLRLTDLLQGSGAFSDVRSVAQVLGFLSHGFVGLNRIPTTHESLASLWFFLEGRSDVRNLASDARDEAMVVLRVPSRPAQPVPELVKVVENAVSDSLKTGPESAKLRLKALAQTFGVKVDAARIDEVVGAATAPLQEAERGAMDNQLRSRLRTWLASDDSPYQPTEEEWKRLEPVLAVADHGAAAMTEVASSFKGLEKREEASRFVETVLAREKDLRFNLRTLALAGRIAGGSAPEAFRVRAQGVFADLLDPPKGTGESAKVTVSGLPVVAGQIEHDLMRGLWEALGLLVGLGALVLLVLSRKPRLAGRVLLEAAVATMLTVVICGTVGPGIDSGSAPIFLLPPLAAVLVCDGKGGRLPSTFMAALALACSSLLLVGVAPVARIGVAAAVGLGCVVLVDAMARRIRVPARG